MVKKKAVEKKPVEKTKPVLDKVMVIGANGIGTFFLRALSEALSRKHIRLENHNILVMDDDDIELKNTRYALWEERDIGGNKAVLTSYRYGFVGLAERLETQKRIKELNPDVIILCADNNTVRRLVLKSGKPFIDMRAEGRIISVFNMIDSDKKATENYTKLTQEIEGEVGGSCQREEDLIAGTIQYGHRISAELGLQTLMNYSRGEVPGPRNTIIQV